MIRAWAIFFSELQAAFFAEGRAFVWSIFHHRWDDSSSVLLGMMMVILSMDHYKGLQEISYGMAAAVFLAC
jgi:hypothetical protein